MQENQKDVFVIRKAGSKSFWHRCGTAFVNRDGSVNVKLDLLPNVDLQIRDPKQRSRRAKHSPLLCEWISKK
jgi:hypothetical protein